MTLREHVGELKHRVKMIVIAYVVCLVFWMMAPSNPLDLGGLMNGTYQPVVSIVLHHAAGLAQGKVTIIAGTLSSPMSVYFNASAILALVTASPAIAYQFFKYLEPGLYRNEKRLIWKFTLGYTCLFAGGALMGYLILAPATIRFMSLFSGMVGAETIITAADYYGFVFLIVGATAIAFTVPAVFVLLVTLRILSTKTFTTYRLLVYPVLYIAITLLTPEPLVAHVGMFFPMVGMMELAVLIGRRVEKNRALRDEAGGAPPATTPVARQEASPASYVAPRHRICGFCGAELGSQQVFCPGCGRSQE
jgi:sec-independent protein translocase protein TatC